MRLAPVDVAAAASVSDLLQSYTRSSFGARTLGDAADVLAVMIADRHCFRILTLSGAMTIAKMGLVICEMLERGWIDAVVSTGALMTHGLVEGLGRTHFKAEDIADDAELFRCGFNRVYDTYELEQNLDDVERLVGEVLDTLDPAVPLGSRELHAALGERLAATVDGRAVLAAAWRKNVPVYVPAFTDSELGLDFALHNLRRERAGKPPFIFDPFRDLNHYAELITRQRRTGIFTIGGGVPRNWAQQVGPYLDMLHKRLGGEYRVVRFQYAVRICPEPVQWGGLSGCTYSEGVSWGKFVPPEEGGRFAEVHCDATIVWPLLVRALIERGL